MLVGVSRLPLGPIDLQLDSAPSTIMLRPSALVTALSLADLALSQTAQNGDANGNSSMQIIRVFIWPL